MEQELKDKIKGVKRLALITFRKSPERFSIKGFCNHVKRMAWKDESIKSEPMETTITRRLRELKQAGIIDYSAENRVDGIYRKEVA